MSNGDDGGKSYKDYENYLANSGRVMLRENVRDSKNKNFKTLKNDLKNTTNFYIIHSRGQHQAWTVSESCDPQILLSTEKT